MVLCFVTHHPFAIVQASQCQSFSIVQPEIKVQSMVFLKLKQNSRDVITSTLERAIVASML